MCKRLVAARLTLPVSLRVLALVMAAAMLSACDKCGDFVPPIKFSTQACKDEAPRPK
jgi:hypothetical protein